MYIIGIEMVDFRQEQRTIILQPIKHCVIKICLSCKDKNFSIFSALCFNCLLQKIDFLCFLCLSPDVGLQEERSDSLCYGRCGRQRACSL